MAFPQSHFFHYSSQLASYRWLLNWHLAVWKLQARLYEYWLESLWRFFIPEIINTGPYIFKVNCTCNGVRLLKHAVVVRLLTAQLSSWIWETELKPVDCFFKYTVKIAFSDTTNKHCMHATIIQLSTFCSILHSKSHHI